jgi:hypothetical protein
MKDIIEAEIIKESHLPPAIYDENKTIVDVEFEYARNNLVRMIEVSNAVMENTAELAIESDHPHMIDAYSRLIKNLSDINKSLFDIREKKMKFKGELDDKEEQTVQETTNITNNIAFVGSSDELLSQINNKETDESISQEME